MDPSALSLDSHSAPVDTGGDPGTRPLLTNRHAMARMRLDLSWESGVARHRDTLVATKLNLWRDLFPPELEADLLDRPRGHVATHRFDPGELVTPWREGLHTQVRSGQFNRRFTGQGHVQPRAGRFYPRSIFRDLGGVFQSDRHPCRLTQVGGEHIRVDFNHPLAERPLELAVTVEDIWSQGVERGGRCNEISALATADGPGMQARWRDLPTDFWSDQPFLRRDPRPDPEFYREPRFVDHIDRTAIAQIGAFYGRLIPAGARILDLMSSWHSHLPESLTNGTVVGLGLNEAELAENPVLTQRHVQDINAEPTLHFADGSFDAVVCTVSVEYLTDPFAVFREVARVLRPGGAFAVTFSNRWFPPKAIQLWEGIHEFERPGLVLEYFLESGLYRDLETWSLRGLPRPEDDKYADRLVHSDPIYAVWATRS